MYGPIRCFLITNEFPNDNTYLKTGICELSSVYPESATADIGWKVYGRIVDGSWGNWLNWGACSVTCGDGTRSRSRSCNNPSPSNGGEQCQGSNVNSQNCNIKECNTFVNGVLLSEDVTTWASAKAACEALSARLVILESQKEIDDMMTSFNILGFDHWIGMTCTAGSNCVWIDGRSVSSGFQAWAPNEPNWGDCVYIGMRSKLWDDTGCTVVKRYICEHI
ncbi:A disintegrin and metalloproteinase with thrombospondin motifs 1-like [Ruditapes philippinarum]|uniref:A disintegrin and metalloproteinase with thrombospondin motifs 1-like n=1 Tax=Ruditapes philippinarum TaxID=129788 RepID=UPI00295BC145|nr:A disintegrin and metalloproteinase with thrombospondin motifs 1-like [Ruditapes philippinarum]